LLDALGKAGAFPIVETRWADAPAAIAEIQPVALAVADPQGTPSPRHLHAVTQCIETRGGPVMPVIALVDRDTSPALPDALPIALDDSTILRNNPLVRSMVRSVESDAERKERIAALGSPTVRKRRDLCQHFLDHRMVVVTRRLEHEKKKLLERLHILAALAKIYDDLDRAIRIIRKAESRADAQKQLMKAFGLAEIQVTPCAPACCQ
jgi:hypothetical protein